MINSLRSLHSTVLLALLLTGFFGKSQNLIVNPGAETALSTEWTIIRAGTSCSGGSNWRMPSGPGGTGYPVAQQGAYFFNPGCGGSGNSTNYEIYQDISVGTNNLLVDAQQYQITFSGYIHSFNQDPPDQATIIVEYLNSTKTEVISSNSSGATTYTSGWTLYSFTTTVPVNTRYMRVRLIGTSRNGNAVDSYFDNLSLTGLSLLPVNMTYFNASVASNKVLLDWQTNTEVNNKGFQVQKSADGIAWKSIGFVAAKGAAVNNYSYADEAPFEGSNYYRLVQEDLDGKTKTSETKFVKTGNTQKPSIFPNPVRNTLTIRSLSATATATIVDAAGTTLGRYTKQNIINVEQLSAGIYHLKIEDGGNIEVLRFIKL